MREHIISELSGSLNRKLFQELCGKVFFNEETIFVGEDQLNPPKFAKPLSPQEKLELFFSPKWAELRYREVNYGSSLTCQGNRYLFDLFESFGYFRSQKEFEELLAYIQKTSGITNLRVLDIGCGVGKALEQMKTICPILETHGVTIEQEPMMFNVDSFHFNLAERMPAGFSNRFHLITSNMAFRYFMFAHIALRNVVLALAKGGYAKLHFSFERMPDTNSARNYFKVAVPAAEDNYLAMEELVRREVKNLLRLESEGKIAFRVTPKFFDLMWGTIIIEKLEAFNPEELSA